MGQEGDHKILTGMEPLCCEDVLNAGVIWPGDEKAEQRSYCSLSVLEGVHERAGDRL